MGYVSKETCASDARVSYAKLTDDGRAKLRAAASTHLRGIDELFIGALLRLGAGDARASCSRGCP